MITDLVESWREHGFQCDVFPEKEGICDSSHYPHFLAEHLKKTGFHYDVIDFPYNINPWIMDVHRKVVKIGRSVLLSEHFIFQPDPGSPNRMRNFLSTIIHPLRSYKRKKYIITSNRNRKSNLRNIDFINVANTADRDCLIKIGIKPEKIIVLPYGLTRKHARNLRQLPLLRSGSPVVAFLGTFDYRKGCLDFPKLLTKVRTHCPDASFRLIGTKGPYVTNEDVLATFPSELRGSIQVIPSFSPVELPGLLKDCHFGIFPSYREGFGIGVVEMLAAGLPVVAYDAPGPCDILPSDWLVPRGEVNSLAARLIGMILDKSEDKAIRREKAREISKKFDWFDIAAKTHDLYLRMVEEKRQACNSTLH